MANSYCLRQLLVALSVLCVATVVAAAEAGATEVVIETTIPATAVAIKSAKTEEFLVEGKDKQDGAPEVLTSSTAANTDTSEQWLLSLVAGTENYAIKNVKTGGYLKTGSYVKKEGNDYQYVVSGKAGDANETIPGAKDLTLQWELYCYNGLWDLKNADSQDLMVVGVIDKIKKHVVTSHKKTNTKNPSRAKEEQFTLQDMNTGATIVCPTPPPPPTEAPTVAPVTVDAAEEESAIESDDKAVEEEGTMLEEAAENLKAREEASGETAPVEEESETWEIWLPAIIGGALAALFTVIALICCCCRQEECCDCCDPNRKAPGQAGMYHPYSSTQYSAVSSQYSGFG
eukprot:gnl/TRDRNA2_/TRDRNA2_177918_c1_seq1.p1 gnl/TRDRNA2_/TRDRNA2_177918_c1~~gnl/TRDRNA2_/TRDRNA2_177918_c1_seq1.p1  ORF type:complete len:344 (+),score=79.57 gnl/TRDRNA2_/TRDRNA2_177918_c1_seq1:46-1077(+)